MTPEKFHSNLIPLFRQIKMPDVPVNDSYSYIVSLEPGDVYIEKTDINTLVMIAFLPIPDNPGEDMLLELLQANLTPDHGHSIVIAADKEDKKLVLWGSLTFDQLQIENLMMILEKINVTLTVIAKWFNKGNEDEQRAKEANEKKMLMNKEREEFLNRNIK